MKTDIVSPVEFLQPVDDMRQNEITKRTATSRDAASFFHLFAQVLELHREAAPTFFRAPVRDAGFDAYFNWLISDPNQHLVLCCDDGVVVGYIQYFLGISPQTIYQPERRLAHIEQVFVAPEFRRTGVATELIQHAMEEAKHYGASQIGLEVWLFNEAARDCFQKAGFQINQASMWQGLS